MGKVFGREPAMILAAVQAVIALVTAFGLDLSGEQIGAIMAVSAAVLGVVTRQSVTPNVSVAAKVEAATPPVTPVAGPAADVPEGEPVEVIPAEADGDLK